MRHATGVGWAPGAGRYRRSYRQPGLWGGSRVLEGDVEGLALIDSANAAFRADGLRFPLAVGLRARAMLAPEADGAAAAADEARIVIGELGAVTLLRGLPGSTAVVEQRTFPDTEMSTRPT